MDAVQDPAEQDSAEMRHEIDSTRSAMADKLEALENRVMDTVQSAQEAVQDSLQGAKDTVASVKRTFDIKHQIEQRPWTIMGGCLLVGLALGHLMPRGRPQSLKAPGRRAEHGNDATAGPAPRFRTEPPSQPGVLEPFREEIDKVKGIAIGYVLGLVRDSIKDTVPQLATQIGELLDGITTKLGGEPIQQQHCPK
jgi:ElaB/YqjD/DUF883 family membrane-anchored ribosome-binding protein